MSILETTQIDGIGKSETENKIALLLADHLDWENEYQHLMMLQEKINAYISFIESGQVYDVFPEEKEIDGFVFELCFKHEITEKCEQFLEVVKKTVEELKIELKIYEL